MARLRQMPSGKGEPNYAGAEDDVARVDISIECHQICDTPAPLPQLLGLSVVSLGGK